MTTITLKNRIKIYLSSDIDLGIAGAAPFANSVIVKIKKGLEKVKTLRKEVHKRLREAFRKTSWYLGEIKKILLPKNMFRREKRKFIRLKAHHLLRYKIVAPGKSEETLSFVRNISASGALFYSQRKIPLGSVVELEINFPCYPQPIRAVARVLRVKPFKKVEGFEIAVDFINIAGEARDFIDRKILEVNKEKEREEGRSFLKTALIFLILLGVIYSAIVLFLKFDLPR